MKLTSTDKEPGPGTLVVDATGRRWMHVESDWEYETYWVQVDDEYREIDSDPESWIKVAGNYGPVEIVLESIYD